MKFTDKLQYLRYLVDKRGMKPVYMILGLTYDCNSFCRTCFNWEQLRKNKEHELSFEELQKTFSSLGDLLFVVMSGGEPFLRRDLPDLARAARKAGLNRLIFPNSTMADRPSMIPPSTKAPTTVCLLAFMAGDAFRRSGLRDVRAA